MMDEIYDLIISGCGPAGAVCGYHAAMEGLKVLILEKKAHPREKLCGGGMPGSAFNAVLPEKSSGFPVRGFRFTCGGSRPAAGSIEEGRIWSVDRARFDAALAEKAVKAGAVLIENTKLAGGIRHRDYIDVFTGGGRNFRGRFVAGADGGFSATARIFGLKNRKKPSMGTCGYFCFEAEHPWDEIYKDIVHLDFSFFDRGVAGIIPKEGHLWIGAYTACKVNLSLLKSHTLDFIEKIGVRGRPGLFRGLFIPLYDRNALLEKDRVLLAGESAGLVNPLSGEGIRPAMESGKIAAFCVAEAMKKGLDRTDYQDKIKKSLGRELSMAGLFERLAYAFPDAAYDGMTKVSGDALKIMNGEMSYSDFLNRLINKIARRLKFYKKEM